MALVSRLTPKRIDIPNEPGEWVEIKPLAAAVALDISDSGMPSGKASIAILKAVIAAWSYPVPVTEETLRDLDGDTFVWLTEQVDVASGVRTDAEKNGSGSTSLPDTSPSLTTSSVIPVSSGT